MLKKISIENYRSCLSTSFECDPHLSVLIGPNGSGKTNILQAIMLLHKMAQEEERSRIEKNRITVSSRIRATFSTAGVKTQFTATVSVFTDESNKDKVTASRQKWSMVSKKQEHTNFEMPLFFAGMIMGKSDPQRILGFSPHFSASQFYRYQRHMMLGAPKSPPKWALSALTDSWRFCDGLRYYGASQFTSPGDCPVSFEIEKEREQRHPYRLGRHARILYDMYAASKATRQESWLNFKSVIGASGLRLIDDVTFKEVTTSSTDYSVRVGGRVEKRRRDQLLVIPRFRIGKSRLSPNQLSEGTFKTIALLFYIMTEKSAALLIEEPEVCIHHGLLSSVLELIKKYSRDKQIIVSTHSDYVLDHVKPENVFRVNYDKLSGSVVRHIRKTMSAKDFVALRRYLDEVGNLGEYWREGGLEES